MDNRSKWALVMAILFAFILFIALPVVYRSIRSLRGEKATPYKSILKSDLFYTSGLYKTMYRFGIFLTEARIVSVGVGNLGDEKLIAAEFDLPDHMNKRIYRIEVGGKFIGLDILEGYIDFRNGKVFDDKDVPGLKDSLRMILLALIRDGGVPEEFLRS